MNMTDKQKATSETGII